MADVCPVIPEELPAQVVESIGRSPEFVFHEDGRSGSFPLVDGALVERQGIEAVKQWLELMLRQKPGAIPIYRTSGTTQPGVEAASLDRRVPEGWIFAEIERNVRETAAFCPAIRTLDSFKFTRVRRGVEVRFTVRLHSGESEDCLLYTSDAADDQ